MNTATGGLNALLAAELRAEAARQQISGRELARRVGKPETTVARYLRGGTAMSLDDIEAFAAALDVSTVDLVMRAYNAPKPSGPFAGGAGGGSRRATNPCLSVIATRTKISHRRERASGDKLKPAA